MIRPRTNVTHLRPVARPYDHERDDDQIWVSATPLEWSVIRAAVERSGVVAAQEPMNRIAEHVIGTQLARFTADIADANHDFPAGA